MKILVGVGNMPLEQLELAPPKSEPRRAVDDADVAGVGADDSSLATLHCPELDQTHLDRRIPIPIDDTIISYYNYYSAVPR